MYSEHFTRAIREAVEPVLSGMGFTLVELSVGRLSGSTRVGLVLYRTEGVGIDDCAEVSRLLFTRLQTLEGLQDLSLEVSSPGIKRKIRDPSEYQIFRGRGVRILAGNATEWIGGVIDRMEEGTLYLRIGKEIQGFAIQDIRKARLDHSMEDKEKDDAV